MLGAKASVLPEVCLLVCTRATRHNKVRLEAGIYYSAASTETSVALEEVSKTTQSAGKVSCSKVNIVRKALRSREQNCGITH